MIVPGLPSFDLELFSRGGLPPPTLKVVDLGFITLEVFKWSLVPLAEILDATPSLDLLGLEFRTLEV